MEINALTKQKKVSVRKLAQISEWTGLFCAVLVLTLVILIGYDVTMRYVFNQGSIALQELEWHLFALIFLLGAGYTHKEDAHVRVDVFYRSRYVSDRQRICINLFGTLFMLIPFCLLLIYSSWPFIQNAYAINETSPDPGGLPYRWLIKAAIPFGFFLLLLQAIADVFRFWDALSVEQSAGDQTQ